MAVWRWRSIVGTMLVVACVGLVAVLWRPGVQARPSRPPHAPASNLPQSAVAWPMYLGGPTRSGYNARETQITTHTVGRLHQHWSAQALRVTTQPIVGYNRVYFGGWDGYEYAYSLSGKQLWSRFIGVAAPTHCDPVPVGIASSGALTSAPGPTSLGAPHPVLYVGGGNAVFYALDALSGAILWQTSLDTNPAAFIWSSPLLYAGNIYVGLASVGDCPLVQGKFFELSAATGAILHVNKMVPDSCLGAGVWGSPTLDPATGLLYIATGNAADCTLPLVAGDSIVTLRASDLSAIAGWAVPPSEDGLDTDFGSTPVLFNATINGTPRNLVGLVSKNGVFYAFDRAHVNTGPLWSVRVAVGGFCSECGDGPLGAAAWDGTSLYVGAGHTTISGQSCLGNVRALDPTTGAARWQTCLQDGFVLAPVSAVPGLLFAGASADLLALDTTTGTVDYTFTDPNHDYFWGPPTIVGGMVYVGNMDGSLFALGL